MISLIMATVDRFDDLPRFFNSLLSQKYTDFEVIVIDQNKDDRLNNMINDYSKKMSINHVKTDVRGLSKARNAGIKIAKGDIIAFPDDDCWYLNNTLEQVIDVFTNNDADVITGKMIDENEKPLGKFSNRELMLNSNNVWYNSISITIFMKRKVIDKIKLMDENLGVGADTVYQSGEETDYLLRAMENNFKIRFYPQIKVCHPDKRLDLSERMIRRNYFYGCGAGYVLRKHNAPISQKLNFLIRQIGGGIVAALGFKFKLVKSRWYVFCGLIYGICDYKILDVK